MIELLCDHGADLNERDDWKNTPLHYADSLQEFDLLKLLSKYDCDLFITNACGNSFFDFIKDDEKLIEKVIKTQFWFKRKSMFLIRQYNENSLLHKIPMNVFREIVNLISYFDD